MRKLSSDPSEVKYIQDACAISDPVFGKQYERLRAFRQTAYERLGTAKDALFDLLDAVLLTQDGHRPIALPSYPLLQCFVGSGQVYMKRYKMVVRIQADESCIQDASGLKLYADKTEIKVMPMIKKVPFLWEITRLGRDCISADFTRPNH